jgi:hypothetical protein
VTTVANVGNFHTRWELLRYPPNAGPERIMSTVTVRTSDHVADFQDAVAGFEKMFLDDTRAFWARFALPTRLVIFAALAITLR